MKIKRFFIASAILLLASCGTEYQAQGLTGGYSDMMTSPNTAIVEFKGNGYLSSTKARKFAFRRAAELTLAKGYDYFLVESGADTMKQSRSSDSVHCYDSGFGSIDCYNSPGIDVEKPRTKLQIRMFKGKAPNRTGYYDARFLSG